MNISLIAGLLILTVFVAACTAAPAAEPQENILPDTPAPPVVIPPVLEGSQPAEDIPAEEPDEQEAEPETEVSGSAQVVEMTNSGFVPAELEIAIGDTVEFRNTGTRDIWPATVVHPTHQRYPGADLSKCFSEGSSTFDACAPVSVGESYFFTFDEEGTWQYHNHLRSNVLGSIIVS